jgi:hypothetical protein
VGEWRKGSRGLLYGRRRNEGKWGKCDLKAGHERPSSSTFKLT